MAKAPWVGLIALWFLFTMQDLAAEDTLTNSTQVEGVFLSKNYPFGDQTLILTGAGVRKQFFLKVYVAALYQSHLLGNEQTPSIELPVVIQLHFLRDVDWDDITEALADGLKANQSKEELHRLKPTIHQLNELIQTTGEVKSGSVLTLVLRETETLVKLNNQPLGSVAARGLSLALLNIWIGDHPVQKNLKRALLGKP